MKVCTIFAGRYDTIKRLHPILFMKRLLTFCCLLTGFTIVLASEKPLDVTIQKLCDKGGQCTIEAKYDSAFYYYNRALSLNGAIKSDLYPIIVNDLATLHYTTGDMDKALTEKLEAIRLTNLKDKPNLEILTDAYSTLGVIYRRRQMQDSALFYYQKALVIAEELKSDEWLSNIYSNLAIFYAANKRLNEALDYIHKAIPHVLKTEDIPGLIFAHQVEGSIYVVNKQPQQGVTSLKKAMATATQHNYPQMELRCIPGIMGIYQSMQKKDSVMYYMHRGDELLKTVPIETAEGLGFIEMKAGVLLAYGQYKEAIKWMQYLKEKPQNAQAPIDALYSKMSKCYYHLGDLNKAYMYKDSAYVWADSIAKEKIATQLSEFSAKYQAGEKELEIARLQQEKLKQEANRMATGIISILVIATMIIIIVVMLQKKKQVAKNIKLMEKESDLKAARKYIEGLENERKRFAKELHDGVANDLLGLQMKLSTVGDTPDDAKEIVKSVNKLRKNVRNISHELMPPEFNHLSIDEIIGYYLDGIQKTYGLPLHYTAAASVQWDQIPQDTAYEVYRITQELITNIIKHTNVQAVYVTLEASENARFCLRIASDGEPLLNDATSDSETQRGIGIHTIEDRVQSISATFEKRENEGETIFLLTF